MLETHITSTVFNWNDVSYNTDAQTIDFEISEFSFELP